jgi:hypothetical protein
LQIAADHVIATDYLIAAMRERIGEMAAKKSGDAGNKNFHSDFVAGAGEERLRMRPFDRAPREWF